MRSKRTHFLQREFSKNRITSWDISDSVNRSDIPVRMPSTAPPNAKIFKRIEAYKEWKTKLPFVYEHITTQVFTWPSYSIIWGSSNNGSPLNSSDEYSSKDLLPVDSNLILPTTTAEGGYLALWTVTLPNPRSAEAVVNLENTDDIKRYHPLFEYREKFQEGEHILASSQSQNINGKRLVANYLGNGKISVVQVDFNKQRVSCFKDLALLGSSKQKGYGLDFGKSPRNKNLLASANQDGEICLWDIKSKHGNPKQTCSFGSAAIDAVAWSYHNDSIFAVGNEKGTVTLVDARDGKAASKRSSQGRPSEKNGVFSLSFSRRHEMEVLVGRGTGAIHIMDFRSNKSNSGGKKAKLEFHSEQVLSIRPSPHDDDIFATSGTDGKVCIWDLSASKENAKEAQPKSGKNLIPDELFFLHSGHTETVTDVAWHPDVEWTLASSDENNMVQIWSPAQAIIKKRSG